MSLPTYTSHRVKETIGEDMSKSPLKKLGGKSCRSANHLLPLKNEARDKGEDIWDGRRSRNGLSHHYQGTEETWSLLIQPTSLVSAILPIVSSPPPTSPSTFVENARLLWESFEDGVGTSPGSGGRRFETWDGYKMMPMCVEWMRCLLLIIWKVGKVDLLKFIFLFLFLRHCYW